jgi:hypothetical protein
MGIVSWVRRRLLGAEADALPNRELMNAALGRATPTTRAMGEYDAKSYPTEMAELLRRRQEVTDELLAIDVGSREARLGAVDKLKSLLRRYPHPLAYEMLIGAFIDLGRWDEARGVAFAARERRIECGRSPYPEIRAECDRLNEWTPEEVDAIRQEREARAGGES